MEFSQGLSHDRRMESTSGNFLSQRGSWPLLTPHGYTSATNIRWYKKHRKYKIRSTIDITNSEGKVTAFKENHNKKIK